MFAKGELVRFQYIVVFSVDCMCDFGGSLSQQFNKSTISGHERHAQFSCVATRFNWVQGCCNYVYIDSGVTRHVATALV